MSADEVSAGQAVYDGRMLRIYDLAVLGLSCSVIWRCPKARLQSLYDEHVGAAHVDVGVGTGYFLDHARWPVERPRVALVDMNPNCLEYTADRIRRYNVTTHRANALESLPLPSSAFDSASANFLLHCMPGSISEKAVLFDQLAAAVRPGGVVFGSTLLSSGVDNSRLARAVMRKYNARGIFHNSRDTLDDLEAALSDRFDHYDVEVKGSVAMFTAGASLRDRATDLARTTGNG